MPANTGSAAGYGTEISLGQNRSIITAAETNQLKTRAGKLGAVLVWNVGVGGQVDIYDNASANANEVYQWVTATGLGLFQCQVPMANGIRVVSAGGTPASFTVIWT